MTLQNRKLIPPPHKCLSPLALALLCVISISSDQTLAEDLIYYGKTGYSGDPGVIPSLKEYSNIDIRITGVPDDYKPTSFFGGDNWSSANSIKRINRQRRKINSHCNKYRTISKNWQ